MMQLSGHHFCPRSTNGVIEARFSRNGRSNIANDLQRRRERAAVERDTSALLRGIGLQIVTVAELPAVKGKERRALDGRTFDLFEAAPAPPPVLSLSLSRRHPPAGSRRAVESFRRGGICPFSPPSSPSRVSALFHPRAPALRRAWLGSRKDPAAASPAATAASHKPRNSCPAINQSQYCRSERCLSAHVAGSSVSVSANFLQLLRRSKDSMMHESQ